MDPDALGQALEYIYLGKTWIPAQGGLDEFKRATKILELNIGNGDSEDDEDDQTFKETGPKNVHVSQEGNDQVTYLICAAFST